MYTYKDMYISFQKNTYTGNQIKIDTFTKYVKTLFYPIDTYPADTEPLILSARMPILDMQILLTCCWRTIAIFMKIAFINGIPTYMSFWYKLVGWGKHYWVKQNVSIYIL